LFQVSVTVCVRLWLKFLYLRKVKGDWYNAG
jgi:hypothetical protein